MRLVARLGGGLLFAATAATTTLVVVACATGTDSVDIGEGGIVEEDAARDVNVVPNPKDSSSPQDSGTLPGDDSGTGTCGKKVVINEVLVDGPNGGEFVEIFNPNTCAVSLNAWKLAYKSKDNQAGGATHTFAASASIASKGFYVVATTTFAGSKDATFNGGLGNAGGQVGLLDDTKAIVDAVGWNTGTAGDYTEGAPAALPPTNSSIARKTDGVDTNDNKTDFTTGAPTPGATN